ncbi:GFO/IDH/MocA family oxidoreductase [Schizosaccharomyces japonicus yFS275]|uniref:GFO/IDH/MocA family oxidoreductase n=1 Tax=Schizosaccharomyces japonicus (strain yFS275 / FY16936) TaxID=402676 RepID=B6K1S9_SCHJY|nr:GFO/IDH/MocA family oxidoreductase [Schizosaccharomyces japonicus yFS275]EEB07110.1 GFO/IDH/MocA family oxidoreductase [Schizosaccharomyces japonicus yFS275]
MAPIRTAVLGTGLSAFVFQLPILAALPEEFEIYACWERRATPQQSKARDAYPSITVYTQLDDLLADKKVDLVIVSLPPEVHFDAVKKSLEAGKHVICEKPFTATAQEAQTLFDLADRSGRLLAVYQNRRWDGDYLTTKALVESGRLGDVVEFESHIDRYRLARKGTWKDIPGPGNGLVYDLGTHLIDQAVALFGAPHSVTAKIFSQRQLPPLDVEDYFSITLHYPAAPGRLPLEVILKSTHVSLGYEQRFVVRGTRGTFLKTGHDLQEDHLRAGVQPGESTFGIEADDWRGTLWSVPHDAPLAHLPPLTVERVPTLHGDYRRFYRHIADVVRSGDYSQLVVTHEQNLVVLRIIEAAYKSSQSACSVVLA